MNKEEKKVALVTGSSHGIGEAIVFELAKQGFKVIINGATTKELSKDYIASINDAYNEKSDENFLFVQADISKKDDREKLVKAIKSKFGKIDVLVNNAGVAPLERNDILEVTEESYERVMKINLQGPFFLTQEISNWMIELQKTLINTYNPYIINISSISSFVASPNRGEYCISKAGMTMMTKLFASRLSEYKIFVYEIQPGIILTPMTQSVKEKYDKMINDGLTPIKRWGLPIDIAKTVVSIVNGGIPFSTGDVIHIDGGFHLQEL